MPIFPCLTISDKTVLQPASALAESDLQPRAHRLNNLPCKAAMASFCHPQFSFQILHAGVRMELEFA